MTKTVESEIVEEEVCEESAKTQIIIKGKMWVVLTIFYDNLVVISYV